MIIHPYGLIPIGGRSTRLGRDKIAVKLLGRNLAAEAARLLRPYCKEVYMAGRDPAEIGLDLPWFPDDTPGLGPIGAVITGLRRLKAPVLVTAADLPLLQPAVVESLLVSRLANHSQAVMTTYLQKETGFIEPLVAVYEPEALPMLQAAVDAGDSRIFRAVPPRFRRHIPYSVRHDRSFFNINTPEDLEQYEELLRNKMFG